MGLSSLTFRYVLYVCVLFLLPSCVRIPQASVDASQLVGERIAATQTSHEAFLTAYFDLSKQRANDYFNNKWVPDRLESIVTPTTLDNLSSLTPVNGQQLEQLREELRTLDLSEASADDVEQAVNRAFGNAAKGAALLSLANRINQYIEENRRILLNPFDELERDALNELRANYNELNQLQTSVTSFLQSASGVSSQQDAVLKRLRLLEAQDQIIEEAATLNNSILDALETAQSFQEAVDKINGILESR